MPGTYPAHTQHTQHTTSGTRVRRTPGQHIPGRRKPAAPDEHPAHANMPPGTPKPSAPGTHLARPNTRNPTQTPIHAPASRVLAANRLYGRGSTRAPRSYSRSEAQYRLHVRVLARVPQTYSRLKTRNRLHVRGSFVRTRTNGPNYSEEQAEPGRTSPKHPKPAQNRRQPCPRTYRQPSAEAKRHSRDMKA